MPPTPPVKLSAAAGMRIQHQPLVFQRLLFAVQEPLFERSEADKLRQDPTAVVRSKDDGKSWCSLGGWLDRQLPADGVLCRKTGLEIELRRRGDRGGAVLLPFRSGFPRAKLVFAGAGGQRELALEAVIDAVAGRLKLLLPFVDPEAPDAARAEALNLYGEVVAALGSHDGAELRLDYMHTYRVEAPNGPPEPRGGEEVVVPGDFARVFHRFSRVNPELTAVRLDPAVLRADVRVRDHRTGQPDATEARVRDHRTGVRIGTRVRDHRAETPDVRVRDHRAETPDVRVRDHRAGVDTMSEARAIRLDPSDLRVVHRARHTARPRPRPRPDAPAERPATVEGSLPFAVQRPLDHPTAYPDLLREQRKGWGHVQGPNGRLYFRDTDRGDTFHYLPTSFQLGYYAEADGSAGMPPMRPELYRQGDEYRVRVTLVAVPSLGDDERRALSEHLRRVVLLDKLPFVFLEPVGGLNATFLPTFTTLGAGGDQSTMPASISFSAPDVDLDDRVLLRFDMPAQQYSIFAELLRKGLSGQVTVESEGAVQERIPVRLSLEDVAAVPRHLAVAAGDTLAEGVYLWHEERSAGEEAEPELRLELANRLPHPVRVPSLRVSLVDSGPVAGMVFDAEEVDLLPGGGVLAARGDAQGGDRLDLPLAPADLAVWDQTVAQPGPLRVAGGSAQEWLDRVHQDPSLAAAEIALRLRTVAVEGAERVQILRLRILGGDGGVRQQRELLPTETDVTWPLRLTLGELAGRGGEPPKLVLEYDCVYADGGISLPQRLAVDPAEAHSVLRPVVVDADSVYTVTHDRDGAETTVENLDRAAVDALVADLTARGAHWRIYPRHPAAPEPTEGPDTPPDTDNPPDGEPRPDTDPRPDTGPTGTAVRLVADLLAPSFAAGELESVFVILQADADGAPQTTFHLDAAHPEGPTWQAPAGVPPFRYRVTYLYADGRAPVRVSGVENGPVLVLDPEGGGPG